LNQFAFTAMKAHEFGILESKLELKVRNSYDRLAWFEYNGKVIARTRRSHGKGFDLPKNLIRQQLKLNEEQFAGILSCSLRLADYIEILRTKGLLD